MIAALQRDVDELKIAKTIDANEIAKLSRELDASREELAGIKEEVSRLSIRVAAHEAYVSPFMEEECVDEEWVEEECVTT